MRCREAAEVLGMSERHFRRRRDRYEGDGAEGLSDRRRGRVSGRRVPVDRIAWLLADYRTRDFDCTVKHFHARLRAAHKFELGATWTKRVVQDAGLVKRAPRRSAHRKKRPRRPLPGMLPFQDGATHAWLAGRPPLALIVTLDAATSELYAAFLVEEEGTFSSWRGLTEVIGRHGLFCSLYTDRGSHYRVTPKAGGAVAPEQLTQVGRARKPLGVEHIPASSPEARGRMERGFGTLQNRLPQELRLAGIGSSDAANRFLAEVFVPEHNRPLCGRRGRARQRVRALRRRARRGSLRAARAGRRQRPLRALPGPLSANPAAPASPPFRQGQGAGWSRSRRGCTPTPTAGSRSSTAHAAWPAMRPMAAHSTSSPPHAPLKSPRRPPGGLDGQRAALPTTPPGQQQQRTRLVPRKPDIFTGYRHEGS